MSATTIEELEARKQATERRLEGVLVVRDAFERENSDSQVLALREPSLIVFLRALSKRVIAPIVLQHELAIDTLKGQIGDLRRAQNGAPAKEPTL